MDNDISRFEQLGLDAARAIAGMEAIGGIRVAEGLDSTDRPTYVFTFLIDADRLTDGIGVFRIRLAQKLRDELIARNDEHYPFVKTLDRTDWERGTNA